VPDKFQSVLHFRPPIEKAAVVGRVIAKLPLLTAHSLVPANYAEAAWREATGSVIGDLHHTTFPPPVNDQWWAAEFMALAVPSAGSRVLIVNTPTTPVGEAWSWLTQLAEELADSMGIDFAQITGQTVTPAGKVKGGNPLGPEVAPGRPPQALGPWTYFGPHRLDEDGLRAGLSALPAARSSATAKGGWVLQASAQYSADVPNGLLQAYAKAFGVPRPRWLGIP